MKNSTRRSFLSALAGLAGLPFVRPLLAAETEPNPDYGKLSEPTFKTIPLDLIRISDLDVSEIYDDRWCEIHDRPLERLGAGPGDCWVCEDCMREADASPLEAFTDFMESEGPTLISQEDLFADSLRYALRDENPAWRRFAYGDWANEVTPEAGRPQPDRGPSAPRR